MHTSYSDGKDSVSDMIRCAIDLGYEEIGFTDHVRKTTEWIPEYLDELDARKKEFQDRIRIVAGVEVKLCDWHGRLDMQDDWYDAGLRVVAAIHRIPNEDGSSFFRKDGETPVEMLRTMWENAITGMEYNRKINCLAHPFNWESVLNFKEQNEKMIKQVVRRNPNLQIEYNVKYANSCLSDSMWRTLGNRVVIGSDSHSTEDMESRSKDLKIAHRLVYVDSI